jgi:hypothetical protein
MTEIWKAIPEYEGLYEASSDGRIRSVDRVVKTFSARGNRAANLHRKGKVLALNVGPHGYLLACLSKDGAAKTRRVNVLVCAAFHGPRPTDDLQACHNNGNKNDNRAANLRWDTAKANQADRVQHGTALAGEDIGSSRLTKADVEAIRASRTFSDLRGVSVSKTHYYRVKRGLSWAHLSGETADAA